MFCLCKSKPVYYPGNENSLCTKPKDTSVSVTEINRFVYLLLMEVSLDKYIHQYIETTGDRIYLWSEQSKVFEIRLNSFLK